jgi:hypothetical protein
MPGRAMADRAATNRGTRFETGDAPSWVIGLLAAIVVGVIALTVGSLLLVFPGSTADETKALEDPMPEPRLQPDPLGDMRDYRARAEHESHSYGWIDRNRGTVRIPVEEASRRILDRGIPDWPETAR